MSLEDAQKRVDDIYGEGKLKLLEYKGNNTLSKIQCLVCGEIFERVPTVLWRNRSRGCPKCQYSLSIGERKVKEILESKKIQYIQQYRFEDCKYKMYLPFDFYLPQLNICIEYQGEQHYNKHSRFYSEELPIRDQIKEQYCKDNNIRLIVIPYWDFENIETYLDFSR